MQTAGNVIRMPPRLVTSRATIDDVQAALLKHDLRSASLAMGVDRDVLFRRLQAELGYDDMMLGAAGHEPRLERRQFEPLVRRLLTMELDGLGFGWRLA